MSSTQGRLNPSVQDMREHVNRLSFSDARKISSTWNKILGFSLKCSEDLLCSSVSVANHVVQCTLLYVGRR